MPRWLALSTFNDDPEAKSRRKCRRGAVTYVRAWRILLWRIDFVTAICRPTVLIVARYVGRAVRVRWSLRCGFSRTNYLNCMPFRTAPKRRFQSETHLAQQKITHKKVEQISFCIQSILWVLFSFWLKFQEVFSIFWGIFLFIFTSLGINEKKAKNFLIQ